MPLRPYGVLKGKITKGTPAPRSNDATPHYHAQVEAEGKTYELAINVKSKKTRQSCSILLVINSNRNKLPICRL